MRASACKWMYMRVFAYICEYMRAYICVYMRVYACICVYMRAYACICVYMCEYVWICVYMRVYACISLYLAIYDCIWLVVVVLRLLRLLQLRNTATCSTFAKRALTPRLRVGGLCLGSAVKPQWLAIVFVDYLESNGFSNIIFDNVTKTICSLLFYNISKIILQ